VGVEDREASGVSEQPPAEMRRDEVDGFVGNRRKAPYEHAGALLDGWEAPGRIRADDLDGAASRDKAARQRLHASLDATDRWSIPWRD
jgi:hypothetical protein